jgi:hypothetical protein
MKTALILSVIAGASAFAPASQSARSTQLAAADINSLRGVGPETGGKVVSSTACNRTLLSLISCNENKSHRYMWHVSLEI